MLLKKRVVKYLKDHLAHIFSNLCENWGPGRGSECAESSSGWWQSWPRSPYSVSSSCSTEVWSKGFYSFTYSFVDTVLPQKGAIVTRQYVVIDQVILEIVSTTRNIRSSLFRCKVNGNKLPWEHWVTHLQAFKLSEYGCWAMLSLVCFILCCTGSHIRFPKSR